MKCIVFSDSGVGCLPNEVLELGKLKKREKGELFRLDKDLIFAIESLPWECYSVKEIENLVDEDVDINSRYICLINKKDSSKKYIFPYIDKYIHTYSFSICEVDTTRKWGIEEKYNGVESIVYYDNLEPISEELNFYRKCFD